MGSQVGKLTEAPTWSISDSSGRGSSRQPCWRCGTPGGGGRYQVFTGTYAGEEPDPDDVIPLIPFRRVC